MTSRQTTVREIMQTEVATLSPGERLDLADDIMKLGRVRHVPVVEGDRLMGVVSHRDLLAASLTTALEFDPTARRSFMRSIEVSEVMASEVVTASPDMTLGDAAATMLRRKIACLPVVDESNKLLGLVTETDLLRAAFGSASDETDPEAGEGAGHRLEIELESLERLRDELRLQIHLGKAEAKERWEELEQKYRDAEAKVRAVASEPIQEIADATRSLLDEIREGYQRIKDAL